MNKLESGGFDKALKENFDKVDKDGSGSVTAEEITNLMIKNGNLKMGSVAPEDFTAAMQNLIKSEKWMGNETGSLDAETFVKFYKKFYNLFYKLDRNGDQKVTVTEALDWFQKREKEKGLTRSDNMYKFVVDFMKQGDTDHDGSLSIVEFFVNLQGFRDVVIKFDRHGSQS